jgi:glycosyltransferase involved in cell wall biosynthesis
MPVRKRRLRVLFIEPFCGGSHRLFTEQFAAHSRHRVETLTLPGSFWKWRLRGAHLSLMKKVRDRLDRFDVLLAGGMLSLAELAGALPQLARIAKVVYFHENQLNYPVPRGEAPDVHFGFTNLSTGLAADRVVFNSRFHREEFLAGIARFLKPMPDHRPAGLPEELRPKCSVVHPGIDCDELERQRREPEGAGRPVAILWNHRWEFDKQPEVFFRALNELAAAGLPFRVHVVGENFQVKPKPFLDAREALGARIATFGHLPRREEYIRVLWDSDIVVSTAIQEFFGIAVMEAVFCGARPLLPRRLVYPELYPEECLYGGDAELTEALRALIVSGGPSRPDGAATRERLVRALVDRGDIDQALQHAATPGDLRKVLKEFADLARSRQPLSRRASHQA